MFITRFIRRDGSLDEEYCYRTEQEDLHHLGLFADDDSGLYERIEVISDAEPDKQALSSKYAPTTQI